MNIMWYLVYTFMKSLGKESSFPRKLGPRNLKCRSLEQRIGSPVFWTPILNKPTPADMSFWGNSPKRKIS